MGTHEKERKGVHEARDKMMQNRERKGLNSNPAKLTISECSYKYINSEVRIFQ